MKIEKIELSGFKSFAEKTSIHLHPGITGIVGPNGCGKSNIVDAIKWLLGEQSAKALRGDKMDELIFNGSQTRKPKGMAEVTLHISGLSVPSEDNGSSENITVISRRIYRSGDSEYAINNNLCRLKDIKDLLLDTGLDVKNYFIFEQERITQITNAKPQDRRFLIEEIAGVIKYKVKKAEALQKLEQSKLNLQRINDIISEVKRQLNSLDRQVKKAERFKKLSEERKVIELYLSKHQFNQLKSRLSELLETINTLKAEEASKRAEIDSVDNALQERRLNLIEKEKSLSDLYTVLEEKERIISENEKAIIQAESKVEAHQKDRERLEGEMRDNLKRIEELSLRINELTGERDLLKQEFEGLQQMMDALTLELKGFEQEVLSIESELEDKRRELFRLSDELSTKSNERTRIQATLESVDRRDSAIKKELEELYSRIEEIDRNINSIEKDIKFSSDELLSLRDKRDEILSEKEAIEAKVELKRQELQRAKEEMASRLTRLNSLRELILNETTAGIFKEADGLNILGIFSDIFEVPERYEKAIEGILSERINTFILPDIAGIKKAITLIKEKGTFRTPLLSREQIATITSGTNPMSEKTDMTAFHSFPNAIKAIDVVKVTDEGFSGFIKAILGTTIIVDSIEEAIRIKGEGFFGELATIDGDIIDKEGIVWAGRGKEVLKRKREIKELESIIDELKEKIEKKNEELQGLKQRLSELEQEFNKTEALLDAEDAHHTALRHNLDNYLMEKERLNKRLSYANIEKEELLKERVSLLEEIKYRDNQIAELETRRKNIEAEIEEIKNRVMSRKQEIDSKRQQYTDLKLAYTKAGERYNSTVRDIETKKQEIEVLTLKNQEITQLIEELDREREKLLREIEELKALTAQHVKEVTEIKDRISIERQQISDENQRFVEIEEEIKKLRIQLEGLMARLNEFDVQRAETVVRIENIKETIMINYGINIEELTETDISIEGSVPNGGGTVEELTERLNSIRKKIEDIGPVNLGTIEEYEELKERYNFLTLQQDDLTRSIKELEEAIQRINATTRKKLREAFDALNEKFGEVFQSLFGGGKASIVLTDENNILESGIEIIAQPPGKRLQNINLLSGGEKALTALSLLVASFLIKPAPLCVLDEADAPLDESNVDRFAQMIKELSRTIQFIIITHNKTTMTYCDYLYGVTMEEPGVSKIISLQLTSV